MKRRFWIFSIILQSLALYLFVTGFFPPRVSVSPEEKNSDFQCDGEIGEQLDETLDEVSGGKVDEALIEKFILVVIDGWREDFLFGRDSMEFVLKSLKSKNAFGVGCKVQHPTVTMPRLKAILGGIVPSYLDVALNLASSEFLEDNWLQKAAKSKKKINFFGDDTWMKMFPSEVFGKSDGTVSFFVTDYTEVDNNVTRHLESEIREEIDSWDIMVLHYLGLDHVGHSLGARSPLIDVKLKEMDRIVEEIYSNMTESNKTFLILVLGDHGMALEGGHGGSTYLETHVPVVGFPKLKKVFEVSSKKTIIEQVDLAPTISFFLGIEVPLNNLGVDFLSEILEEDENRKLLIYSLMKNGNQLKNIIKKSIKKLDPELVRQFFK
ncbi:hypothetical protein FO519_003691 [Halicephalobus sp. NKZ332]|nr:hypothetical protein FO519_003691 [Halicephalobus sp. NKZ332]